MKKSEKRRDNEKRESDGKKERVKGSRNVEGAVEVARDGSERSLSDCELCAPRSTVLEGSQVASTLHTGGWRVEGGGWRDLRFSVRSQRGPEPGSAGFQPGLGGEAEGGELGLLS